MAKIGILTFHASHNYGSMLQAYALQHYLEALGHDVEIINLRSESQRHLYSLPWFFSHPIKANTKAIIESPIHYIGHVAKWIKFEKFIKQHYRLTKKEYKCYSDIGEDLSTLDYDLLISGGDQIWNQKCVDFELSYFLPFPNVKKKISFSPSLGNQLNSMMESPYVELYKTFLPSYQYISVREHDSASALSFMLNKEVQAIPDATFLLDVNDYHVIMPSKPLVKGKYVLYYTPSHIYDLLEYETAKKWADSKGLRLVTTNAPLGRYRVDRVQSCGPCEFLKVLKDADFVIGKSFHLAVFSLLFHKDFAIIDGNKDKRVCDLLMRFGLQDRGVPVGSHYYQMNDIDFKVVDAISGMMREEARQFLKDAV